MRTTLDIEDDVFLAVTHGGKLATFDRSIPISAVIGGEEALDVVRGDP